MITVTGATGNIGRPLVNLLADAGHRVTALARGTSPLPARDGVDRVAADLSDLASLRHGLDGAKALFLLVTGDALAEGLDAEGLLGQAREAGVRRLVLLSSQLAATRPASVTHAAFADLEGAVRASGLNWTILRPAGFMSNDLWWAPTVAAQRTVLSPYADVALPVVAPFDVAAVAAEALAGDGHDGRTYTLTGPESLSPRRRVELLGAALGERLTLVELDREAARAALVEQMPEPIADGTLDVLGHPLPDEQTVTTAVADLVGRPATPYAAWARHVAGAFR